ncbi:MAG: hypothetical protein VR68_01065 [Peptococcaceae bacterium BRH_c4a]|nr:MAG: hypothetical protein VR68_01065 [Peptococcaceae bacterium BRH_c4a]
MQISCQVNLFGGLQVAAGNKTVRLTLPAGATVEQVLEELIALYGNKMEVQLKNMITREFVDYLLLINQKPVRLLANLDKPVQNGDELLVLSICSGG